MSKKEMLEFLTDPMVIALLMVGIEGIVMVALGVCGLLGLL